jgi:hypothetical protein
MAVRRVGIWCEMAASLWGCEPRTTWTSSVGRHCQVTQWRPWLTTLVFACQWFVKCMHELHVKCQINLITNPNPTYSHSIPSDNIFPYTVLQYIKHSRGHYHVEHDHSVYKSRRHVLQGQGRPEKPKRSTDYRAHSKNHVRDTECILTWCEVTPVQPVHHAGCTAACYNWWFCKEERKLCDVEWSSGHHDIAY